VFDSHCGTHVDVPSHVIAGGRSLDEMPLDTFVGPAQKVRIEFTRPGRSISVEDLPPIMRTRIIFHTGWSDQLEENPEGYFTQHTDLTEEAARYLVTLGVQVVGIDCPSVDRTGNAAHMVLLGSNVIIIENLTNTGQLPDFFDLITLPLRIQGVDGCPVRAVAITGEVTQ
jgi:arylformamidase